jgi:hypothetical protein
MSNEGASDFMTFAEVSANREWTANSFLALGDRKLRSVTSEMSRNVTVGLDSVEVRSLAVISTQAASSK